MKKLMLRSEHLGELTPDDLRRVIGAGPQANTISDGSCVCTISYPNWTADANPCDISDGSCACACQQQTGQ